MNKITLGERLNELIAETGLDKQEIAAQMGIKRSTFSGYVNNSREPKLEMLKVIAKYFDVTVDYLIGNSDERNPSLDYMTEDLNLFVRDPENVTYIELAREIKQRTNERKKA